MVAVAPAVMMAPVAVAMAPAVVTVAPAVVTVAPATVMTPAVMVVMAAPHLDQRAVALAGHGGRGCDGRGLGERSTEDEATGEGEGGCEAAA